MTRRGAIIAALLLAGGNLVAKQRFTTQLSWPSAKAGNLQFSFGGNHGFEALQVVFGDGTIVTFTEADLKRELVAETGDTP